MADIPVFGKTYPLVGPSEFNLGELNDAENLFGATFNDEEVNSRKLAAILYTSIRRVDQRVSVADVRNLTPQDLEAINTALEEWQSEDDEQLPPAEGVVETPSSENGSSGSSVSESESVPSPTGNLL